ncbi:Pentatricopeptide repeat [Dillenia turbinata]|uniref:Pentatricopeptide repeat n=1 Tax=Dillenia turbinata TaxID=194707 RepID=A0AAN8ZP84_9MAGN
MLSSSSSLITSCSPLHIQPNSDPSYKALQNHPSLSLLSQCNSAKSLKQIHSQIIKSGLHNTQFALSKLVEFCAISSSGDLSYALLIFKSISNPNQIIWNTIIRGHCLKSYYILAVEFYVQMLSCGVEPNSYTFPFLLKSCAKITGTRIGKQVHGHVLKMGFVNDVFVHSSLVNMYAQIGELGYARLVFDKSSFRDAVSFTALITGYTSRGYLDKACQLFDEIPVRDVVSWNAIIAGYAQSGKFEEALAFYNKMLRARVQPNESTLLTVLSVCAQSSSLDIGKQIHSWIEDKGVEMKLRLNNGLIDMYSKCGDLETARNMFEGIKDKDVISWNVMIGGYAHLCRYKEALSLFQQMHLSDIEPNDVTFLNVLPACAYLGALEASLLEVESLLKEFRRADAKTVLSATMKYAAPAAAGGHGNFMSMHITKI